MCINKSIPIEIISEYLDHENIPITLDIYGHLYPNLQYKLVSLLEKQDQKQNPKNKNPYLTRVNNHLVRVKGLEPPWINR